MSLKISVRPMHLILIALSLVVSVKSIAAETVTISSTNEHTYFLELYTSQGCNSCPPAEHWIAQFTENKNLWKSIIPLNFHVSYWDYLGWKDPFGSPVFSQRQRAYVKQGKTRIVATPGFMIDGKGWQGWFRGTAFPKPSIQSSDTLTGTINKKQIMLDFDSITKQDLVAHVAILGFGIKTNVKAGENKNRVLAHDFVVIGYQQGEMKMKNHSHSIDFPLPDTVKVEPASTAIVFWVSTTDDQTPIQVAADWLE